MKKISASLLLIAIIFSLCSCESAEKENLAAFYNKITESRVLLDSVADDIYSNWYDAVYKDSFNDDIDIAIAFAQLAHSDDIEAIKSLDSEISTLFKELKDTKNSELIKEVMSSYSAYYELVINVSGSFRNFSDNKEPMKKELAGLLKELSYEL